MADNSLAAAVRSGNYTAAVKLIDLGLKDARGAGSAKLVQLLCNRAYCYHQLGLLRNSAKACCSAPAPVNFSSAASPALPAHRLPCAS